MLWSQLMNYRHSDAICRPHKTVGDVCLQVRVSVRKTRLSQVGTESAKTPRLSASLNTLATLSAAASICDRAQTLWGPGPPPLHCTPRDRQWDAPRCG